jgi:hypothetical protein
MRLGSTGAAAERRILAFVHIEKAAGTTLIHILRRNFFPAYCDVRPLSAASNRLFRAEDLKRTLRINPFIRCIGGHAVRPVGDLVEHYPGVRFITMLRDPARRYISQYQYLTNEMKQRFTFQEFLDGEEFDNFQTRKIVGSEDVEAAKRMLSERFLLVGIMEQFDEFLLMLQKKLAPAKFDPAYQRLNIARDKELGPGLFEQHHDEIMKRNRLDQLLYEYVKSEIIPSNRDWYGEMLEYDLDNFKARQTISPIMALRARLDYLARKGYIEPLTGAIRRAEGLRARGSY